MRERGRKGKKEGNGREGGGKEVRFLLNALILENGITRKLKEHFIMDKLLV